MLLGLHYDSAFVRYHSLSPRSCSRLKFDHQTYKLPKSEHPQPHSLCVGIHLILVHEAISYGK